MDDVYQRQQIGDVTVVEFRTRSLMDPVLLERLGGELFRIVDQEDRRRVVLDFERVEYLSSQAIGIVIGMNQRLGKLDGGRLALCSVGPKLTELIKILGLDRVLTIKPSQQHAVNALA